MSLLTSVCICGHTEQEHVTLFGKIMIMVLKCNHPECECGGFEPTDY